MTPLIRVVSIAIVPIAFLIAFTHLLGAESGPGDGFTAGIVIALALTLQYETLGSLHLPSWLARLNGVRLLLAGLALAALTALTPLLWGDPLLSPAVWGVDLPLVGHLELKLTTLFDTGVALVVFGGAMLAITSLRLPEPEEHIDVEEEA
jgi:multisubunit Na+/H+ antiporter MnhB subunit